MNFQGSRHWLSEANAKLVDSVDFVLCLDSLASSPSLYLHSTKAPKDETAIKMHEVITSIFVSKLTLFDSQSSSYIRYIHEIIIKHSCLLGQRARPGLSLSSNTSR